MTVAWVGWGGGGGGGSQTELPWFYLRAPAGCYIPRLISGAIFLQYRPICNNGKFPSFVHFPSLVTGEKSDVCLLAICPTQYSYIEEL